MQKFAHEQRIKDALSLQREMEAKLKAVRAKEERARQRMESGESKTKRPVSDYEQTPYKARSEPADRS